MVWQGKAYGRAGTYLKCGMPRRALPPLPPCPAARRQTGHTRNKAAFLRPEKRPRREEKKNVKSSFYVF